MLKAVELTEVVENIWRVPIHLPMRTEPVNAWLLRDESSGAVTIFDTGIQIDAEKIWVSVFDELGSKPSDTRAIIVSHQHPDHVGGARALHQLTRAPLLATQSTIDQVDEVWGYNGKLERYMRRVRDHVRQHGMPDAILEHLKNDHVWARSVVELPEISAWNALHDQDQVLAGGSRWRVITTPGHSDGHIVLHAEDDGILLAGDHLLERISPAVGNFPGHEPDPLGRYLESLNRVADLDNVINILPGHGAPFTGVKPRVAALLEHHRERLDQCVSAVEELTKQSAKAPFSPTAFDVATVVFARIFTAEEIDPVNARFATTETLAHLLRAEQERRVKATVDADGLVRWVVISA